MVSLNSDPEVVRYTGDAAFRDIGEARVIVASLSRQFQERRLGRFIVVRRADRAPIGWCGLRWTEQDASADLGFRFLRACWGQGYATEAGRACLEYGRALGIERTVARAMPANIGSVRVLQKLGMRAVGDPDEEGFQRFEP